MNLKILQYNHKNDALFCAPNSLYLQIHSMINSYIDDGSFHEIIQLDDIARSIGFNKSSGSMITTKNLSKLSNRINKLKLKKKLNAPMFTLSFLDNTQFFKKLSSNKKNQIFTICISFSQYYKFLKTKNNVPEYYNNAESSETDYIQHCITLIMYYEMLEIPKYIIIDPNIELSAQHMFISINEIEQKYSHKIINVNLDDINKLLTMRYDSIDDDRIIIGMEFESNSSLEWW